MNEAVSLTSEKEASKPAEKRVCESDDAKLSPDSTDENPLKTESTPPLTASWYQHILADLKAVNWVIFRTVISSRGPRRSHYVR